METPEDNKRQYFDTEVTEVSEGTYAVHLLQEQPVQGIAVYKYFRYWECECGAREDRFEITPNLCSHLRTVFHAIKFGWLNALPQPRQTCIHCGISTTGTKAKQYMIEHIWQHRNSEPNANLKNKESIPWN